MKYNEWKGLPQKEKKKYKKDKNVDPRVGAQHIDSLGSFRAVVTNLFKPKIPDLSPCYMLPLC